MRKMSKWSLVRVLLALLSALYFLGVLGVAWIFTFDHKAKIAESILYNPEGELNKQVVTAALTARFPAGSNLQDVLLFVEMLDGRCEHDQKGTTYCTLPVSGTICVVSIIKITVTVSANGAVENIVAESDGQFC